MLNKLKSTAICLSVPLGIAIAVQLCGAAISLDWTWFIDASVDGRFGVVFVWAWVSLMALIGITET